MAAVSLHRGSCDFAQDDNKAVIARAVVESTRADIVDRSRA